MRRSTIIATCLVNSGMIRRLEDAERAVHQVFVEEFPNAEFGQWDLNLDDRGAEHIIKTVGRASTIKVKKFIEDLWPH